MKEKIKKERGRKKGEKTECKKKKRKRTRDFSNN